MSTKRSGTELKRVYNEVKRAAFKRGRVGLHDYEDIAQEAMIRYLNKSRGSFAPRKWINLAVQCVTWDLCRKRQKQLQVFEEFSDEEKLYDAWARAEFNQAVCESSEAEANLDRKYLEIALIGLLGEGTFAILKLYADGFSYQEIAQKVDMKIGTVRSRLHYAKSKARRMLEV